MDPFNLEAEFFDATVLLNAVPEVLGTFVLYLILVVLF